MTQLQPQPVDRRKKAHPSDQARSGGHRLRQLSQPSLPSVQKRTGSIGSRTGYWITMTSMQIGSGTSSAVSSLTLQNLPAFVAKDLKAKFSRGFGSHGIHRNMTKAQLDELLQLEPKLIDNTNFINAYSPSSLLPDGRGLRLRPRGKGKAPQPHLPLSKRLAPAHNSLKANAIYHMLRLQPPGANGTVRFSWNTSRFPDGACTSIRRGRSLAKRPSNRSKPCVPTTVPPPGSTE